VVVRWSSGGDFGDGGAGGGLVDDGLVRGERGDERFLWAELHALDTGRTEEEPARQDDDIARGPEDRIPLV
jgi:hypothetical protein